MKIASAFLANYAELRDGLVYVSGAFPEWYTVPDLPATAPLAAVWVLELEESEVGRTFLFDLGVRHPSGVRAAVAHVGAGRSNDQKRIPGAPIFVAVTYSFGAEFHLAGRHEFELVFDGELKATMPIVVELLSLESAASAEHVNQLIETVHDSLSKMSQTSDRETYLELRKRWQEADEELKRLLPPSIEPLGR